MIMVDRHRRLAEPLQWGTRERIAVGAVLAVLIAGIAALVVAGGSSRSHAGCVEVTFPSTLGVARIEHCGTQAREMCAHPGRLPHLREQVIAACRHARIA